MNIDKSISTIAMINEHIRQNFPEIYRAPKLRLGEQTSIKFSGDFGINDLTQALRNSFFASLALQHTLPEWIVEMQGMSGKKFRYLLNNLIKNISFPSYLEVGSWAGSTACSCLIGNEVRMTCIDDWSQFEGPKDTFLKNTSRAKYPNTEMTLIESDFRKVDFSKIGTFKVYFFDGPHEAKDQYDGILIALPALEENFILIVDDYNWVKVREGTQNAFNQGLFETLASIEILTVQDRKEPVLHWENSDWHNGYLISVCKKT